MRIDSITLENFRGFENLTLKFDASITVLIGLNGSGKTSVLDAIATVLGPVLNVKTPGYDTALRFGAHVGRILLKLEPAAEAQVDINPHGGSSHNTVNFTAHDLEVGPLPVFCYYLVNRHAEDATAAPPQSAKWVPRFAWNNAMVQPRRPFEEFFQWFREREDLENELRRSDPTARDHQLEAVRTAIVEVLRDYRDPRVRRPRFEGNDISSRACLVVTKANQELPFDALSEGERSMISLVGDIARRAAIARPNQPPLDADGTVLIDEIDLHLHPRWQIDVIATLKQVFPNLQFIVTTHSPLVLRDVDVQSVRYLENFKLKSLNEPTKGRDPNTLLTDVFGVAPRPKDIELALDDIARLLDAEDIDGARAKLDALASKLGEHDSDVTRLRTYLDVLAS